MRMGIDGEIIERVRAHLAAERQGRANAATKRGIAFRLSITTREFELAVHELRRQGVGIGSNARGYFLCADAQDFSETFGHIMPRFASMRESVEGLKKAEEELMETAGIERDGQRRMF